MLKEWIKFNKLENFISILNYTIDDFTPSGKLRYMNQHGDILHQTPLKEVFNVRWYTQHLMDESEHETENPLSHQNWMKQTNWKFNNSNRNLSKKFSRNNMKTLMQRYN